MDKRLLKKKKAREETKRRAAIQNQNWPWPFNLRRPRLTLRNSYEYIPADQLDEVYKESLSDIQSFITNGKTLDGLLAIDKFEEYQDAVFNDYQRFVGLLISTVDGSSLPPRYNYEDQGIIYPTNEIVELPECNEIFYRLYPKDTCFQHLELFEYHNPPDDFPEITLFYSLPHFLGYHYDVQINNIELKYTTNLFALITGTIDWLKLSMFAPFHFGERRYYRKGLTENITLGISAFALSIKHLQTDSSDLNKDLDRNLATLDQANQENNLDKSIYEKFKNNELLSYLEPTDIKQVYNFYGKVTNRSSKVHKILDVGLIRFDMHIYQENSDKYLVLPLYMPYTKDIKDGDFVIAKVWLNCYRPMPWNEPRYLQKKKK